MTETETILIGADHAGFALKEHLKDFLIYRGYDTADVGTFSNSSCNYPEYAENLVQLLLAFPQKYSCGILICGTGIGMSVAANKYNGIRAALCRGIFDAEMSRRHNDANILCLGARLTDPAYARKIVTVWLDREFEAGRHKKRIKMFNKLGSKA